MKNIGVWILCMTMTGCATIINGPTQSVGIGSSPAKADCKIGENATVKTPSVISLKRNKNYLVYCELPGYQPSSATIGHRTSMWLLGDIILGGLIGLVIDVASGGAYKLIPDNLQLTLQPIPGGQPMPSSPIALLPSTTTQTDLKDAVSEKPWYKRCASEDWYQDKNGNSYYGCPPPKGK